MNCSCVPAAAAAAASDSDEGLFYYTIWLYIIGAVSNLATFDQINKLYTKKDAGSVSGFVWLIFTLNGLSFTIYGVWITNGVVLANNALGFVVSLIVVVLVVAYKDDSINAWQALTTAPTNE